LRNHFFYCGILFCWILQLNLPDLVFVRLYGVSYESPIFPVSEHNGCHSTFMTEKPELRPPKWFPPPSLFNTQTQMLTHPCTYLIEKDCTLKYLENKKCQVFFSQDETEKDLLNTINLSLTFFSVYRQRQTVWLDKWQAKGHLNLCLVTTTNKYFKSSVVILENTL
jgi:hypothetical protein